MNPDGTVCYTEEEDRGMDWREIGDSDQIEWVSLLDPHGPAIAPPCFHDDDECPAKQKKKQKK